MEQAAFTVTAITVICGLIGQTVRVSPPDSTGINF